VKLGRKMSLIAIAVVASFARHARADDSWAARLFDEGRALMLEGRLEEGCNKFAESQKLEPRTGTLLNMAACHEKSGKTATAWTEYKQVAIQSIEEKNTERERFARQRVEALEPKVSWITIQIPRDVAGEATVTLDDRSLFTAWWERPMPIDPGEHKLTVTMKGRPPRESTFFVAAGEHRTISVAPTAAPSFVEPPAEKTRAKDPTSSTPVRKGFTLELGIGVGVTHVDIAGDAFRDYVTNDDHPITKGLGFAPLSFSLGHFVSRGVAILFRAAGTSVMSASGHYVFNGFYGVHVQGWLGDRFMISGGPGLGLLTNMPGAAELTPQVLPAVSLRFGPSFFSTAHNSFRLTLETTFGIRKIEDGFIHHASGTALNLEWQHY